MRLSLVFTHCPEKVFHRHSVPPISVEERLSGLNNEVLSWQAVYCLQTPGNETRHELCYQLDGRWRSISACASAIGAERFSLLSRDRRELPDDRAGLISRSADAAAATAFFAACRYYGSLWLTLTPPADAQLAGDFPLTLRLLDAQSGEALAEARLTLHLVPAALPPQTLLHTEWLHTDCPGGLLPSGGVQPGLLARSAPLCALRGACRG